MSAMSTNFRKSTRRVLQAFNNNYGDGGYPGDIQKIRSLGLVKVILEGFSESRSESPRVSKSLQEIFGIFELSPKMIHSEKIIIIFQFRSL